MSEAPAADAPGLGPPPEAKRPEWEDPRVAFPRNLFGTWVHSLSHPTEFFRGVPFEEAAARPILYYLLIAVTAALCTLWWDALLSRGAWPLLDRLGLASPGTGAETAVLGFFFSPFAALVGLVVGSSLLHLFVLLLARERRAFSATLRTVCYASGPTVLAILPFAGTLVGALWSLVLTAIGLRAAHRMTGGAAALAVILAVLVPWLLLLGLLLLALVAGIAAR